MADAEHFRERVEVCLSLARDSTDPVLVKVLAELAAEYAKRADKIEASASRKTRQE